MLGFEFWVDAVQAGAILPPLGAGFVDRAGARHRVRSAGRVGFVVEGLGLMVFGS